MTELPVRLAKGDPAPEDCVAVPLHGPDTERSTWDDLATFQHRSGKHELGISLDRIADAAEAPRPLRKGDRVKVGSVEATVTSADVSCVRVEWGGDYLQSWLPPGAYTRIDESSANPLSAARKGDVSDKPESHEGHTEGAGGSQDPGPTQCPTGIIGGVAHTTDGHSTEAQTHFDAAAEAVATIKAGWTPAGGMLVEQISDGVCFRLGLGAGDWPWFLTSPASCGSSRHPDSYNTPGICSQFRPRFLRVGDVIDKVESPSGAFTVDGPIEQVSYYTADVDGLRLHQNEHTVHVEGLGVVPLPPPTKEANQ